MGRPDQGWQTQPWIEPIPIYKSKINVNKIKDHPFYHAELPHIIMHGGVFTPLDPYHEDEAMYVTSAGS